MPVYFFRAVHRASNGEIGPALYEERIEAPHPTEAIAKARAISIDLTALNANAVYLTDTDGRPLWSLHAAPPSRA